MALASISYLSFSIEWCSFPSVAVIFRRSFPSATCHLSLSFAFTYLSFSGTRFWQLPVICHRRSLSVSCHFPLNGTRFHEQLSFSGARFRPLPVIRLNTCLFCIEWRSFPSVLVPVIFTPIIIYILVKFPILGKYSCKGSLIESVLLKIAVLDDLLAFKLAFFMVGVVIAVIGSITIISFCMSLL